MKIIDYLKDFLQCRRLDIFSVIGVFFFATAFGITLFSTCVSKKEYICNDYSIYDYGKPSRRIYQETGQLIIPLVVGVQMYNYRAGEFFCVPQGKLMNVCWDSFDDYYVSPYTLKQITRDSVYSNGTSFFHEGDTLYVRSYGFNPFL